MEGVFKIGVVADTHIPDRTPGLNIEFLAAIRSESVDLILHAGDISTGRVLDELEEVAPVIAVRGNRDFLLLNRLPLVRVMEKHGVQIALMHGHMNFVTYWLDKLIYIIKGYDRQRYTSRLGWAAPEANVYIFGHTHHAENFWHENRLYFNPGSITYGDFPARQRSWGILEIHTDGRAEGRILPISQP